MNWYVISITALLFIIGGVCYANAKPIDKTSWGDSSWRPDKNWWPFDWMRIAGQFFSVGAMTVIITHLQIGFKLPRFAQKPLLVGSFYFAIIMIGVLVQFCVISIVNPAKLDKLLRKKG